MYDATACFERKGKINGGDWVLHKFRRFYPKTHKALLTYLYSFIWRLLPELLLYVTVYFIGINTWIKSPHANVTCNGPRENQNQKKGSIMAGLTC